MFSSSFLTDVPSRRLTPSPCLALTWDCLFFTVAKERSPKVCHLSQRPKGNRLIGSVSDRVCLAMTFVPWIPGIQTSGWPAYKSKGIVYPIPTASNSIIDTNSHANTMFERPCFSPRTGRHNLSAPAMFHLAYFLITLGLCIPPVVRSLYH